MAMNEDGNAAALLGLSESEKRAKDLGKRISVEAEAWKVAQLAATLMAEDSPNDDAVKYYVEAAMKTLAEVRKQVSA